VQEICPLRSTWRGLESTWESASDVAGLSRMAPVLDPTYSARHGNGKRFSVPGSINCFHKAVVLQYYRERI
jgi:hypothetical protein